MMWLTTRIQTDRDRQRPPCWLPFREEVYRWCMSRTNIDIDDDACQTVMDRFHLQTKRDAVNYALRLVAAEVLELDDARALRGSGWEGDLAEMRSSRAT